MSDKQVDYFGALLAKDSAFGSKHAKTGESVQAFEQRIKQALKDPINQTGWAEDLKRVGFDPLKQNK